jgi:tRNA U34 5-methylaminomethyl-2-thiouridine-forming methyltransferase MnmC
MDNLEIITTSDGSHTIRNRDLNETYHSIHGAVQESMHVFIKNGLHHFCRTTDVKETSILEIGFGTGLNALLSLQYASEFEVSVKYTTLEPFPLPREVWSSLNYDLKDRRHFISIHEASWGNAVAVTPMFTIVKAKTMLQDTILNENYDVIFFDAFAPSVQPELWVYDSLKKVIEKLNPGGVFVTYSARGQLKRDLKALGLTVETLPGAPGKMQMVRGVKREERIV